ncbi:MULTISPECIES: hypothetical protein [Planktothricoides]|uniref:Uncharacterized protein n=1 Tax=Planktothricoides raciborskii GIHE-MW2 TaxID=2792601 RepID=A0AAU8JGX8_9CYAN|nr:hypothetical protein [Planktothricoides sp. SR001]
MGKKKPGFCDNLCPPTKSLIKKPGFLTPRKSAIAPGKRNRVSALTVASPPKFWLRNPVSETSLKARSLPRKKTGFLRQSLHHNRNLCEKTLFLNTHKSTRFLTLHEKRLHQRNRVGKKKPGFLIKSW